MYKKKIFTLFAILCFFLILEIISFFTINFIKYKNNSYFKNYEFELKKINNSFYNIKKFLLSDYFSQELGWDNFEKNKLNKFKARLDRENQNKKMSYITFGSSFTWGDGVQNNETWQYYLSKELDTYVANFGVGGFSAYQALLKFKNNKFIFHSNDTVILTIFESEIDRMRNGYSNFYFESGFRIRPLAQIINNSLYHKQLPNFKGLNIETEYLEYIKKIKELDPWWNRKIDITFPYSIKYINYLLNKLQDRFEMKIINTNYKNAWNNITTNNILIKTIEDFKTHSNKNKLNTIIVLLPRIRNKLESGYKYQDIKKSLNNKNICIIDFAEYVNFYKLKNNQNTVLNDGHYSKFTYQLLAKFMAKKIEKISKNNFNCEKLI